MLEHLVSVEWRLALAKEFGQDYFQELCHYISSERQSGSVFPAEVDVFKALNFTPPSRVKVVILGQDPYHQIGQAEGLSFSVPKGVKIPASLRNIFKELERDLTIPQPTHGHLESWAEQGVLLLNCILTVSEGRPNSHAKCGWQRFTDAVIQIISEQKNGVVFMLWGSFAQKKAMLIDSRKHFILEAAHPSPLSAHRGFLGCGHFRTANELLTRNGQGEIDWQLI